MSEIKEVTFLEADYKIKLSHKTAQMLELEIGDEIEIELEYDHLIISKMGKECILCGSKRDVEYFGGKIYFCKRCLSDMCRGLIEDRHKEYLEEMKK